MVLVNWKPETAASRQRSPLIDAKQRPDALLCRPDGVNIAQAVVDGRRFF